MKRDKLLAWLWNAVRVTLGFLFLLAASGKFRNPIQFMGGMDEYGLIREGSWLLPIGAVVLPGIEWLGALMLLLAWRPRAAALTVSGMLLLFIGAMASAMHRHVDMDCSCFDLMGADPSLLAHGAVVRDLALTGLALVFHFLGTEPSTLPRPRLWRGLLIAALFAWTTFALLDAGPQAWRVPARHVLEGALALWVVFDIFAAGWATLRWGAIARDALVLGPVLWFLFHALGGPGSNPGGQGLAHASWDFFNTLSVNVNQLGWGTLIRDVCMAVPALGLALYGPAET